MWKIGLLIVFSLTHCFIASCEMEILLGSFFVGTKARYKRPWSFTSEKSNGRLEDKLYNLRFMITITLTRIWCVFGVLYCCLQFRSISRRQERKLLRYRSIGVKRWLPILRKGVKIEFWTNKEKIRQNAKVNNISRFFLQLFGLENVLHQAERYKQVLSYLD